MSDDGFSISYDSSSLLTVQRMFGYQALLSAQLSDTTPQAAQKIIDAIPKVTSWQHSMGILDFSFYIGQSSAFSAMVTSDVAWARRRDLGFSGMTDSLGRYYPNDPGADYADKAIAYAQNDVETLYEQAIQATFGEL